MIVKAGRKLTDEEKAEIMEEQHWHDVWVRLERIEQCLIEHGMLEDEHRPPVRKLAKTETDADPLH